MKLLIINSNMNKAITQKIDDVAKKLVNADTHVDVVCAGWGVPVIEGNYDAKPLLPWRLRNSYGSTKLIMTPLLLPATAILDFTQAEN